MSVLEAQPAIELSDEFRWSLLQRKAQEARVRRAFELFRQHGIEPVLIKGLAAAAFYPANRFRQSIDMDLAVRSADFDAADALTRSGATEGLAIDLHRELRHLDSFGWDDLFENSRLIEFDGYPVRVLRVEDHLRVLCVHWLTDGGSNRDKLWDIYYIVDNRPVDFDWKRVLDEVSPRRRRWLTCTVGLTSRYLGLDLNDTPIPGAAHDLPAWLVRAVESEWSSDTKHLPLEAAIMRDPQVLMKQLRRRFLTNPLWATVQMEGSFDARTRIFYQIGSILNRIQPSFRRIAATIKLRLK